MGALLSLGGGRGQHLPHLRTGQVEGGAQIVEADGVPPEHGVHVQLVAQDLAPQRLPLPLVDQRPRTSASRPSGPASGRRSRKTPLRASCASPARARPPPRPPPCGSRPGRTRPASRATAAHRRPQIGPGKAAGDEVREKWSSRGSKGWAGRILPAEPPGWVRSKRRGALPLQWGPRRVLVLVGEGWRTSPAVRTSRGV
eukprot:scaffold20203_cov127-Isochrysis_galbana.AAC.3